MCSIYIQHKFLIKLFNFLKFNTYTFQGETKNNNSTCITCNFTPLISEFCSLANHNRRLFNTIKSEIIDSSFLRNIHVLLMVLVINRLHNHIIYINKLQILPTPLFNKNSFKAVYKTCLTVIDMQVLPHIQNSSCINTLHTFIN